MRTTRLGRCPGKGIAPNPDPDPVPRSANSSRGYNCVRLATPPPPTPPPTKEEEADPSVVAST